MTTYTEIISLMEFQHHYIFLQKNHKNVFKLDHLLTFFLMVKNNIKTYIKVFIQYGSFYNKIIK